MPTPAQVLFWYPARLVWWLLCYSGLKALCGSDKPLSDEKYYTIALAGMFLTTQLLPDFTNRYYPCGGGDINPWDRRVGRCIDYLAAFALAGVILLVDVLFGEVTSGGFCASCLFSVMISWGVCAVYVAMGEFELLRNAVHNRANRNVARDTKNEK